MVAGATTNCEMNIDTVRVGVQVLTVSLDAAQIATGMPTSGRVGRHGEDE